MRDSDSIASKEPRFHAIATKTSCSNSGGNFAGGALKTKTYLLPATLCPASD
jgi:hypothetical protein